MLDGLTAALGPLDAGAPLWAPWVALAAALLLLLALTLGLAVWRRGAALAAARAEADRLAEQPARNEARAQTEAVERAGAEARRAADLDEARRRIGAGEAALAEAKALTDALRREQEKRLNDAADRYASSERKLAALIAQTGEERRAADEKIQLVTQMRDEMARSFKELADASLKASNEELTKASRERLEQALNPLKEHVTLFQTELRAVHEGALRDRQALKTEIEALTKRSEEVSKEATALTRALKGDKQRQGAWGEMILESLLDRSGLRKGEEYLTQTSHGTDEGGRVRSDVIVNMPNGSALVVDSKVSLIDYEAAVNAESEDEALAARRRHVVALRRHIDTLGSKNYQHYADVTVDYVVMFVPIEGALSEALREAGDLTQYAMDRNVTIATPTTLMMALRTVASFWTIDRRNRNAEEIAKRAGLLYDKVAGFTEAMEKVGGALTSAQTAYGTALDRLSRGNGNVLAQVDMLKRLGARASKQLKTEFEPEDLPALDDDAGTGLESLPAANDRPAE
ncbi:DNA recombination protein RmuC [Frigidibacter sp. MR17.14]|uniref:DNA recombination protein RmuC n=1 Tax=Frigidibacter sp. MR17.14 TaxID=3126509 RepID=UPI00301318CA